MLLRSQVPVSLTTVSDPDDGDEDHVISDHVDHTVVADAKPHRSLWIPGQRPRPGPTRIQAKLGHRSEDTTGDGLVELSQFPKCWTSPFDLVTHRSGDAVLGQHLTVGNPLLRARQGVSRRCQVSLVLRCLKLPQIIDRDHRSDSLAVTSQHRPFLGMFGT